MGTQWVEKEGGLERNFRFADFNAAFGFMTRVALEAERMRHHPTWTNTWDHVWVRLSTHDAGHRVTAKDRDLAAAIDRIAGAMGAR
ncbi:MAG: 4a-hydroxytetrahydrobiopterin dehydratase [Flavobacteriales bacterium]|jgi:4a-hydroxytetrahydrobiopterin dehydratase|nr:4a-hydroxytetrahydrobiopterin dehydratase [Flavobacteriales bacterium]MBK7940877.1 4a-hydroxytetrahydrobiopterin dehydratase [Flavobacteriales bacterium]MBK8948477.1 4a-hydroxytetrahydrobiopterin dehydratase [Flavobacteriales bacterium]MBK9701700.1 4a-hydroxytetrahydrobiopterin dehydratase [Flavobacteriales bacterium]